ncbi:DUF2635 domain-containing protein [Paraburkholderia sp. HD33-4]|uniref:DUF2635 domain-containing protein n=1 Tax=Paraburkholderia sp. HD33-4 TaxID=2883242 RepID=UPI003FA3704D
MKTLRISPVEGRVVRDPALRDLVTAPRNVPDTPFWRRRIRDGDVSVEAVGETAPAPATPATEVSAHTHRSAAKGGGKAEGEAS